MKRRTDNTKRFPRKNAEGKNQCQDCGKPTEKGKLPQWWHPECLEAYLVRSDVSHAAKRAHERDKGVCWKCGTDTKRIEAWLATIPDSRSEFGGGLIVMNTYPNGVQYPLVIPKALCRYGKRDRFTKAIGSEGARLGRHKKRALVLLSRIWGVVLRQGSHLVEIDHIVPVAEGGGGCGLDNLRTLCRKCHTRESAALNRRLRKRPTKGVGRGF